MDHDLQEVKTRKQNLQAIEKTSPRSKECLHQEKGEREYLLYALVPVQLHISSCQFVLICSIFLPLFAFVVRGFATRLALQATRLIRGGICRVLLFLVSLY